MLFCTVAISHKWPLSTSKRAGEVEIYNFSNLKATVASEKDSNSRLTPARRVFLLKFPLEGTTYFSRNGNNVHLTIFYQVVENKMNRYIFSIV